MKLYIESDGTVGGTHVLTEEGLEVQGVKAVTWEMDAKTGKSIAIIKLHQVPVKVAGESGPHA